MFSSTLSHVIVALLLATSVLFGEQSRPNILWITCEDISPYLGSYGCEQAHTPNLDKLAEDGVRYTQAYAPAPVCAPARSALLTGMHCPTIGTHHMRSHVQLPREIPAYAKLFRNAGYYCSNNKKEDYNSNFEENRELWDVSAENADWSGRNEDQPFFAVINFVETHESRLSDKHIKKFLKLKKIPEQPRVNPSLIQLPPYHPDLPEIRQDWARLHDLITLMDRRVGDVLTQLQEDGLADDTIVLFYSDHGGMLSRSKRYLYNVGTQVPLIIYFPEKYRHLSPTDPGTTSDELVTFVDLPKTMLSLADIEIPDLMQGRIFLGPNSEQAPDHLHFYRDRMAERYDMVRAVTDGRYYYMRNFMPHRPRGRDAQYGFTVQANWRAWRDAYEAGYCDDVQSKFYEPKPIDELYDTWQDPWHIHNLAQEPEHQKRIAQFDESLDAWMIENRDLGLIPEALFAELAGPSKPFKTIYAYGQSDEFPVEELLEAAKASSSGDPLLYPDYIDMLSHLHPAIQNWGAYGLFLLKDRRSSTQDSLLSLISDSPFAANRIMAAQALAVCGNPDTAFATLMNELENTHNGYSFLAALNALDYAGLNERVSHADWQRLDKRRFPGKGLDKTGVVYAKRMTKAALKKYKKIEDQP